MKSGTLSLLSLTIALGILLVSGCDDIIEPSLNKQQVTLEAPANLYTSASYTVNFWWDQVDHAHSYHLQVVTPNFAAPGSLVLDTIVRSYKFSFNMIPGNYQWRVMAENGSSQTAWSVTRSFSVAATSIKQQSVQLINPANTFVTNQNSFTFQWSSLFGATQYRFEIDTNNFADAANVVSASVIPGQQISFTFPKDQVYQWRVRAENDTAQAQWSAVNSITFDQSPPAQVSPASPADGVTLALPAVLQWGSVPTASRYNLYIYKSDATTLYSSAFPATLKTTSYTFNLGNSGDKVYWKVSAVDAAGNEGTASTLRSFVLQ